MAVSGRLSSALPDMVRAGRRAEETRELRDRKMGFLFWRGSVGGCAVGGFRGQTLTPAASTRFPLAARPRWSSWCLKRPRPLTPILTLFLVSGSADAETRSPPRFRGRTLGSLRGCEGELLPLETVFFFFEFYPPFQQPNPHCLGQAFLSSLAHWDFSVLISLIGRFVLVIAFTRQSYLFGQIVSP